MGRSCFANLIYASIKICHRTVEVNLWGSLFLFVVHHNGFSRVGLNVSLGRQRGEDRLDRDRWTCSRWDFCPGTRRGGVRRPAGNQLVGREKTSADGFDAQERVSRHRDEPRQLGRLIMIDAHEKMSPRKSAPPDLQ